MKNTLILLVIILAGCGWVANKYVQKANTSNKEKNRFIEFAEGYDDSAKLFVIEQAKQHHDAAFASAYRMWILSPITELDLASAYDEQAYYRTIAKKIKQASKRSNEAGAHLIVQDIAKYYHVKVENTEKTAKDPAKAPNSKMPPQKESLLKSGKLGDKRTIPSSRKRYDDW